VAGFFLSFCVSFFLFRFSTFNYLHQLSTFYFGVFIFLLSFIYSNFPASNLEFCFSSFYYLLQFSSFHFGVFTFLISIIYAKFPASTLEFSLFKFRLFTTIFLFTPKKLRLRNRQSHFCRFFSKFWRTNPSCNTFLNPKFHQLFGCGNSTEFLGN
jgi:hypothetical protein